MIDNVQRLLTAFSAVIPLLSTILLNDECDIESKLDESLNLMKSNLDSISSTMNAGEEEKKLLRALIIETLTFSQLNDCEELLNNPTLLGEIIEKVINQGYIRNSFQNYESSYAILAIKLCLAIKTATYESVDSEIIYEQLCEGFCEALDKVSSSYLKVESRNNQEYLCFSEQAIPLYLSIILRELKHKRISELSGKLYHSEMLPEMVTATFSTQLQEIIKALMTLTQVNYENT